jgi:PAS domain S-box-containing protein
MRLWQSLSPAKRASITLITGIISMLTSALVEWLLPGRAPVHPLLLTVGVALMAYAGGWRLAMCGIGLAALSLQVNADASLSHVAVHSAEWIVTSVIVLLMRAGKQRSEESESKLRALFGSMDDVILILDRDGTYKEIAPTNPSLLYKPAADLIGRRIIDVFPKASADVFLAAIEHALNDESTVTLDYSLTIAEKRLWFSALITPLDGATVIWVARDITERKNLEDALENKVAERTRELSNTIEALNETQTRFELVARATSDAIYDVDIETGRVWRGSGYETLFGYAEGEMQQDVPAWATRIHPDDWDRIEQSYKEALATGAATWSAEYRFRRKDGSYANILDKARIVRDAQNRARVVGAMVDVTDRKQLEQQLEQAKRVTSLGRVAASIAHEVNNVLMGIQPNAEVVLRKGPETLRPVSENIIQAVRRGKRVTDEILRFTRPSEPALQCLDVLHFLQRWSDEIRPVLGPSIDLDIATDGSDMYALADPLQLTQVFTNLALNARDAMQEKGGKLTITAEMAKSWGAFRFGVVKSPDRFVHFIVRDEGCGISNAQLAHIFEPLFTTKRGGVGLGLAITYQVVLRHGGHIFVESEVGKGSTFHIFIPNTLPAIENKQEDDSPQLLPKRVLLVEDEEVVADGISMLLEMDGIAVETVTQGGEAVDAIERFAPDAVVLDIGLPDVDGVTVYHRLASRWPDLPVLFSSGHGDSAQLEAYLARPNVGFILKPYEYESVRSALAQIVQPA